MTGQNLFSPVEYIVVEFPGGKVDSEFFEQVLALVVSGALRILDLEFIVKPAGGYADVINAGELSIENVDTTIFDGASAKLLDASDVAAISEDIEARSIAAVLFYERLTPLATTETCTGRAGEP